MSMCGTDVDEVDYINCRIELFTNVFEIRYWATLVCEHCWFLLIFFSSYRGHIEIHSKVRGRQHIRRVRMAGLVVSGGIQASGIAYSWHLRVPYLYECKLRPGCKRYHMLSVYWESNQLCILTWTKLRKSGPIQLRSMRQCRTTRIWTRCYPSVPVRSMVSQQIIKHSFILSQRCQFNNLSSHLWPWLGEQLSVALCGDLVPLPMLDAMPQSHSTSAEQACECKCLVQSSDVIYTRVKTGKSNHTHRQ